MPKSKPQKKLTKAKFMTRPRKVVKQDITKEQFLANLSKVCQPLSKESAKSDSEKTGTLESHPSDDCIGTNTR